MVHSFLKNTFSLARNHSFNRVLENWLDTIELPELEPSRRTVVFNTVRSNPKTFHLYTDLFIGHFLARIGCRVIILLDDGILSHWDSVQRHRVTAPELNPMHSSQQNRSIKRNVAALWEIFETPGLGLRWYSDFLVNAPDEAVDEDVERYALASTLRHFERGFFEPNDQEQQDYYRLSLKNAKISKAIGRRVIDQIRPDIYATSHGIYSTWGPAYSVVRNSGISTVVYAHHPYHLGGFMIDDAPGGSLDRDALEHYLRTGEFSDEQRATAQAYLAARYSHQASDTKEYFGGSSPRSCTQYTAPGDGYECTFGLFPNVAWDAIGDHLAPIYESVIDWIVDTVRKIGKEGRHRLIIRFHPAELTRLKGTLSTEQLVRDNIPNIDQYRNVVVIKAQDKVNSYDLLRDVVDVALVYTGTLGAEAQPLGVPVVSAASGRFSEQFVHIAADQAEYRKIIGNPEAVIKNFKNCRARIIESVLKYHFYISDVLFFPMAIMSKKGRHIAGASELRDQAEFDNAGLKRTLQRFLI